MGLYAVTYHKGFGDTIGIKIALIAHLKTPKKEKFLFSSLVLPTAVTKYDSEVDPEFLDIVLEGMGQEIRRLHNIGEFKQYMKVYVNEIKIKKVEQLA